MQIKIPELRQGEGSSWGLVTMDVSLYDYWLERTKISIKD